MVKIMLKYFTVSVVLERLPNLTYLKLLKSI